MKSNLPNWIILLLSVDSKVRSTQSEATQLPSFTSTATGELVYIHSNVVSMVDAHLSYCRNFSL